MPQQSPENTPRYKQFRFNFPILITNPIQPGYRSKVKGLYFSRSIREELAYSAKFLDLGIAEGAMGELILPYLTSRGLLHANFQGHVDQRS